MDIGKIITLITAGTQLVDVIGKVVGDVTDKLSETDRTKLEAALKELQAKNDETFNRLDAKLTEAANR